jgi:hypothetical protein
MNLWVNPASLALLPKTGLDDNVNLKSRAAESVLGVVFLPPLHYEYTMKHYFFCFNIGLPKGLINLIIFSWL